MDAESTGDSFILSMSRKKLGMLIASFIVFAATIDDSCF